MLSASLATVDASDDLRAVSQRLLSVESSVLSGHSLADDLRVLVDENVRFVAGSVNTAGSKSDQWVRLGQGLLRNRS